MTTKKHYFQSQYILNKVFENETNHLRATLNTSQDYLNAVYDSSKNAIRIKIEGEIPGGSTCGGLNVFDSVDNLPATAQKGQLCPVYESASGGVVFYEWDGEKWQNRGQTSFGGESGESIKWLNENLERLKELVQTNYLVNSLDVTLPNDGNFVVDVQGVPQNIDDDLDGDNDTTTPYRIDVKGYVMEVATYPNENAPYPERYLTRITYDTTPGGVGMSHIYLQQDEYDYFAALANQKNIVRVYYLSNAANSPVKRQRLVLNQDYTVTSETGSTYSVLDTDNQDGDATTFCRIPVAGYAIGIETFADNDAKIPDKYYTKMIYESSGAFAGDSWIYMEREEYDKFSSQKDGKNCLDAYYVSSAFTSSVRIVEREFKFPADSVELVALDSHGNRIDVSDSSDKDGDSTTHVLITVAGFALDACQYYAYTDTIKKRVLVKMNYNSVTDTTDIYLEREQYNYIAEKPEGKNVFGVYCLVGS